MNTNNSRKILFCAALFTAIISFSSCNRGYGCPYELKSITKVVLPVIK